MSLNGINFDDDYKNLKSKQDNKTAGQSPQLSPLPTAGESPPYTSHQSDRGGSPPSPPPHVQKKSP